MNTQTLPRAPFGQETPFNKLLHDKVEELTELVKKQTELIQELTIEKRLIPVESSRTLYKKLSDKDIQLIKGLDKHLGIPRTSIAKIFKVAPGRISNLFTRPSKLQAGIKAASFNEAVEFLKSTQSA